MFKFRSVLFLVCASACSRVDGAFVFRSDHIGRSVANMRKRLTFSKERGAIVKQSKIELHRRLKETRGGGTALFLSSDVVFNNAPMWQSFSIIGGINLLGLTISLATGSHLHLDLLGTGAFTLAVLPQLLGSGASDILRVKLSASAVAIWATKLAGFLFYRALKVKHDARLGETLSTVSGTVGFWIISTMWGVVCSLPHTLGSTSPAPGSNVSLKVGTSVYMLGLIIETAADYQKWMFKASNPKSFCNVGLWSVSQHPNWLGNVSLWLGILIMNASALNIQRFGCALLSPLLMLGLFYGQASGGITNSVELARQKYGSNAKFNEYVKNVPLIFPRLLGKHKEG